jgi:hypothetical protein
MSTHKTTRYNKPYDHNRDNYREDSLKTCTSIDVIVDFCAI